MPRDLWDAAQSLLAGNAPRPHTGERSLLGGMLVDEQGRPMATEHANKAGRRYRYYVSRAAQGSAERSWRIPAGDLDAIVAASVTRLLDDPRRLAAELGSSRVDVVTAERCAAVGSQIEQPASLRALLEQLDARVSLKPDAVTIALDHAGLARLLGCEIVDADQPRIELHHPVTLKRRGHELRLIYTAVDERPPQRDKRLIQLLASGRAAYDQLCNGDANASNRRHLTRLARLRFLAPDIVTAILEGRQPVELTSRALLRSADLPIHWTDQRTVLGFV